MHCNPCREALRASFLNVPSNIEPTFRSILELLEGRRLDGIDGNTLAGCEDADDAIPGQCTPVRREAHWKLMIDAADGDRGAFVAGAGDLEHHRLSLLQTEPSGFRLGRGGGRALFFVIR